MDDTVYAQYLTKQQFSYAKASFGQTDSTVTYDVAVPGTYHLTVDNRASTPTTITVYMMTSRVGAPVGIKICASGHAPRILESVGSLAPEDMGKTRKFATKNIEYLKKTKLLWAG